MQHNPPVDTNISILVAEDDADDRFLLETAFKENGFTETLCFVENGIEVIEYLQKAETRKDITPLPTLILLDLNMPKKDGREVLKELKQNPAFKQIPIIIFSTTQNETEVKRCYELGADSYMMKPDTYENLLKAIVTIRNTWIATPMVKN